MGPAGSGAGREGAGVGAGLRTAALTFRRPRSGREAVVPTPGAVTSRYNGSAGARRAEGLEMECVKPENRKGDGVGGWMDGWRHAGMEVASCGGPVWSRAR